MTDDPSAHPGCSGAAELQSIYSDRVLVSDLARSVRADLASGASKGSTLRLVRQFVMDADASPDPSPLMSSPPESTGDERWDTLIAGVCEDIAFRHGTAVPAWTTTQSLTEFWFVTDFERLHPTAFLESPPALARRGVFMRRSSLINV